MGMDIWGAVSEIAILFYLLIPLDISVVRPLQYPECNINKA